MNLINTDIMRSIVKILVFAALATALLQGCENDFIEIEDDPSETYVGLDQVAEILAMLPITGQQLGEVHSAVTSSSENGYDEEYTMWNLFDNPGAGVGDPAAKGEVLYSEPMRDLIEDYVYSSMLTKSAIMGDPDDFLNALVRSDIQIYWPFSTEWDGETMPIVTFDPEDGSDANIGYRFHIEEDGSRSVEEVIVDEKMASQLPIWVVNRNSDAGHTSLEMLRRNDPQWGEGGGTIVVHPSQVPKTRANGPYKVLILRDFVMNRNYDSWFSGASEFFVRIGYIEDFTAMTEAEMRLYDPMITDLMIVVKRSKVGVPQNINAVLMTDWCEDIDWCAFQLTEDDGGTLTEWSTKAKVYVEGKSYGFELKIPLNSRDDIVWRGKLDYQWFDKLNGKSSMFGDVGLTFEIAEY